MLNRLAKMNDDGTLNLNSFVVYISILNNVTVN